MDLPELIREALVDAGVDSIEKVEPVGGGRSSAARIHTGSELFFAKWDDGADAHTFEAEAAGLRALREIASSLVIPKVVAASNGPLGYVVTTWVHQPSFNGAYWSALGEGLAELHRASADAYERYGFAEDNFIGPTLQRNTWETSWPSFFRTHRLEPQRQLARERGLWRQSWDEKLEMLYALLADLLPEAPAPALLHGDLWSGNVLPAGEGRAAIIDPAVYVGHREADLAMTELFGRFGEEFYRRYNELYPLDDGYTRRRSIYNLYHLINHLNIFGRGYAGRVANALDQSLGA